MGWVEPRTQSGITGGESVAFVATREESRGFEWETVFEESYYSGGS